MRVLGLQGVISPRSSMLLLGALVLVQTAGAQQSASQRCLESEGPATCLSALEPGSPGLDAAWMEFGAAQVKARNFEAAEEAFERAGASGLVLWMEQVTSTGVLPPLQAIRARSEARRILRADSLDPGARMVLGEQDAREMERRARRMSIPTGLSGDDLTQRISSSQSGGRVGFTYRRGGETVDVTVGQDHAGSRLHSSAVRSLRLAMYSEAVAPFALRRLAQVHLTVSDYSAMAGDASWYRRTYPDDALGYLVGLLAAERDGRPEAADALGEMALQLLPSELANRILDPSSIISTDEAPPVDRATWWREQDPIALTVRNERLTEHLVRWAFAEIRFGQVYGDIIGASTDPGQVIMRYGIPLAEVQYTGGDRSIGQETGWDAYRLFQYEAFDFRFMDMGRAGSWSFYSPRATAFQGGDRVNSEVRAADYVIAARERFRSIPTLVQGSWQQYPLRAAAFREGDGVEVVTSGQVPVAFGNADTGAMVLSASRRIVSFGDPTVKGWSGGQPFVKAMSVPRLEGAELLARVEAVAPATLDSQGGTAVFQSSAIRVPGARGLALSSVLLADAVDETESGSCGTAWFRKDLCIVPSPDGAFADQEPLYAYFEVYGLALSGGGSDYEVTTTISRQDGERRPLLARLFRRGGDSVGAGFRSSSSASDIGDYLLIDRQTLRQGEYLLRLQIHDRIADRTLETTATIRFD